MKNTYLCLMLSSLLVLSYVTPVRAEDAILVTGGETKSYESISITNSGIGAQVDACDGGNATLNVQNDVSVSCSDEGQEIVIAVEEAAGKNGSANATIGGDIIAQASSPVATTGIDIFATDEGSATISVNGDINTIGTGNDTENYGIKANASDSSSINIDVAGDINTEDAINSRALDLQANGSNATISTRICGDINGNEESPSTIEISTESGATVNVVAEGTITAGSESNIVFSGDPNNISLVIWKAEYTGNDPIVKESVRNEDDITIQRTTNSEVLEKAINYIIKVNTTQSIELDNTTDKTYLAPDGNSKTYNTAKEGERVAVRLTIPDNYELSGVFSDEEQTCELLKDENGQYYLVVPKGGGIYVNMSLAAKQNTPSNTAVQETQEGQTSTNQSSTAQNSSNTSNSTLEQAQEELQSKLQPLENKQAQIDNHEAERAELEEKIAELVEKDTKLAEKNAELENKKAQLTKQLEATNKSLSAAVTARDTYKEKYENATKRPDHQDTSSRAQVLSRNNAVGDGNGGYIAQGGHVQINGGKSNVTFTLAAPTSGVLSSANKYANSVGGTLLHCVTTSSPGVSFKTAEVNFTVTGVYANDIIAVYQLQGKNWVQVMVTSVTDNHVKVCLTQHGPLAFVRMQ
ncbi:MAG: hypothetical protein K6E91_07580 [Butyrivibrio sp.]|nr:hypothetical protein [Butyrivibrio sp.]